MIFCVKSQKSILFSLLKIWPGPTKDFVAEAGSSILAVPQAVRAHSGGDVFCLCLYIPACAHVCIVSNHGSSIRISFRYIEYMIAHSRYRNFSSDQQEIEMDTKIILVL